MSELSGEQKLALALSVGKQEIVEDSVRTLDALEETDLRAVLRPHWEDPEGISDIDKLLREGFDSALNRLAALELGISTGYLSLDDARPTVETMRELLSRRAVARFIDDYDYFQVRFLANRMGFSQVKPPDFKPAQFKLPDLPAPTILQPSAALDETVNQFLHETLTLQESPEIKMLFKFLDDFEIEGVEKNCQQERFRLWLAENDPRADGKLPKAGAPETGSKTPDDSVELQQFRIIKRAINSWVMKRFERYDGQLEAVQARLAIFDIYWLLKLFNAEMSASGDLGYCGGSWIRLLVESPQFEGDDKRFRTASRTLRRALGLACDWIRREAIEVLPSSAKSAGIAKDPSPIHPPSNLAAEATSSGLSQTSGTKTAPVKTTSKKSVSWFAALRTKLKLGMDFERRDKAHTSVSWIRAFKAELEEIFKHRRERHLVGGIVEPVAVRHGLIGLAFSGGGIRSATFNLGVLEALKENDLLRFVDYLSTVSGGGYIGSWLVANAKRRGYWVRREADWRESVKHLRDYSNYLSPHLGLMSPDTWTMWTTFLRNTILVQLQVLLAIAGCLLVPYLLRYPFNGLLKASPQIVPALISGLLLALVTLLVCASLLWPRLPGRGRAKAAPGWSQFWIPAAVVLFVVSSLSATAVIWRAAEKLTIGFRDTYGEILKQVAHSLAHSLGLVFMVVACYGSLVLLAIASAKSEGQDSTGALQASGFFARVSERLSKHWRGMSRATRWTVGLAPAGALTALLLEVCALILLLQSWVSNSQADWRRNLSGMGVEAAFVFGPTLVMIAIALSIFMLIGLLGKASDRQPREWWSRFGALLSITATAWLAVSVAAIYSPYWLELLTGLKWIPILGWIGTTLGSVLAGKSGSTSGEAGTEGTSGEGKSKKNVVLETLAVVGPFIAIAGIVVAVAAALHAILLAVSPASALECDCYWASLGNINPGSVGWTFVIVLAAGFVLTGRVNINIFSLSEFYRSRLVRCYLGATRSNRSPHPFTGFDEKDDMLLASLRNEPLTSSELAEQQADKRAPFAGPFPIVNCTLNLGGSSDLAVKTRQSDCFTLTPLHCGYNHKSTGENRIPEGGYSPTEGYLGRKDSPTFGLAVAVSGAAASPNMGYHTSPLTSFLMTLFNARLGCWFANPAYKRRVDRFSPHFAMRYLVKELFGTADDASAFVAVSDGGHFENLGVYELVRRRCRLIIASDAECDPEIEFESLGKVIRLCEVDFGTKIKIDVSSIRRDARTGRSKSHCAVGRIEYGNGSLGTLIYVKASLLEEEDTAVLQYRSEHRTFPHESTANQFFTEDQFESYRKLGYDCAKRTFRDIELKNVCEEKLEEFAEEITDIWTPVKNIPASFISNTTALSRLWETLGTDEALAQLSNEIINHTPPPPEWKGTVSAREFYFCNEIIQLMENVHLDLHLDDTWEDPDNAGWKDLFLRCARSKRFQAVWEKSCGTYGKRFHYFCRRKLNLN